MLKSKRNLTNTKCQFS